jgi:nitrogen regulatory protein PII 2
MIEVTAIIRRDKVEMTKKALEEIGCPSMTIQSVEGRGKQRGSLVEHVDTEISDCFPGNVKIKPTPSVYALEHTLPKVALFVPKKMLTIVVPDEFKEKVIKTIISVNQTGKPGDGKIFVSPVEKSLRVRTGEENNESLI